MLNLTQDEYVSHDMLVYDKNNIIHNKNVTMTQFISEFKKHISLQ